MKLYFILLFGVITSLSFAQSPDKFNRMSLEASIGAHVPLSPVEGIGRSEYLGARHATFGLRYMFTRSLGAKVDYAYNGFRNSTGSEGITYNSVNLSAVYNLGRLFLHYTIREKVTLLSHAGAGITFAQPLNENFSEKIGNFRIGLTPTVRLTNRVALFGDASYVFNVKQHYTYSGDLISTDYEPVTGSFATISFGAILYLGEKRRHADWY